MQTIKSDSEMKKNYIKRNHDFFELALFYWNWDKFAIQKIKFADSNDQIVLSNVYLKAIPPSNVQRNEIRLHWSGANGFWHCWVVNMVKFHSDWYICNGLCHSWCFLLFLSTKNESNYVQFVGKKRYIATFTLIAANSVSLLPVKERTSFISHCTIILLAFSLWTKRAPFTIFFKQKFKNIFECTQNNSFALSFIISS